jgi:hypothetical protein
MYVGDENAVGNFRLMTTGSPAKRTQFISPFLLPYILADIEDRDKLLHTAIEQPSPEETLMHSPMEYHSKSESHQTPYSPGMYKTAAHSPQRGVRVSESPNRRFSAESPGTRRQSMIERSISELTFDPELTFMDSPAASIDPHQASPSPQKRITDTSLVSLPEFSSPMKIVSPDRSIVPLDESEIGFSNQLRESMRDVSHQDEGAQGTSTARRSRKPAGKAVMTKSLPEEVVSKSSAVEEDSKPVRSSRRVRTETAEPQTPAIVPTRSLKRKATRHEESEVKAETASSTVETRPAKRAAVSRAEPPAGSVLVDMVETLTTRPSKATADAGISRKSPRFASKVVTAITDIPPLMICPSCKKAYKRARDYEKHVAACK